MAEGPHHTGGDGREAPPRQVRTWAEVGTLLLVAAFFAFSFFAGRVRFFVAPYYLWLSPLAAAALSAMAIARLAAHVRGGASCCEAHEHGAWRVPVPACIVVLLVPMALAVAVNPRRYSPQGLRKRAVKRPPRDVALEEAINWVLGAGAGGGRGAAAATALPKNPTILDVLNAAHEGDRKALDGQFVTVLGQCDLPEGPTSKRFDLYRLVVTCCIADATAVSIEVSRRSAAKLEPGGWVRVEGMLKFETAEGGPVPVIRATRTTRIPEPSEPYL